MRHGISPRRPASIRVIERVLISQRVAVVRLIWRVEHAAFGALPFLRNSGSIVIPWRSFRYPIAIHHLSLARQFLPCRFVCRPNRRIRLGKPARFCALRADVKSPFPVVFLDLYQSLLYESLLKAGAPQTSHLTVNFVPFHVRWAWLLLLEIKNYLFFAARLRAVLQNLMYSAVLSSLSTRLAGSVLAVFWHTSFAGSGIASAAGLGFGAVSAMAFAITSAMSQSA